MSDDNLLKTDHKIRPKSVGSKESEPDRTDLKTSTNKIKDVKKGKSEDEDMRVSIDNLHKEPPKSKKRDKSSDIEDQDQNKKRLRERDLRSQDKHTEGKIFYTSKTKDGLLDNEIYKYGVEEEQTSNGIEKKKTIKKETETSRRIGEADRDATKMKDDYGQEYRTGKKRSRVGLDKKNLKKDNVTIENKTKTQKIPLSTEELIKKGEEQPRKVKMRDDVRGKSEDLQETTETRKKILENQRIASDKKELLEQKLKTEQVPSDKDVVIDQRDKSLSKKDMFGYKRMPQGQENEEKSLKEKVKAEQVPRDKYLVDKGVTKDHRDKGDLKMIQDKIFQGEKEKRSDDEFRINDTNKKAIKKKVVDDRGMKCTTEKVLEEKQKQVHEIGIITGVKDRSEEQTLTGNNTEAPKVKGVDVNYHMEQARKSKIRDDAKDKSEDLEETAERRKKILENQRITSVEKNILGKKRKTEQVQADRDVAVDQRDKVESKMEMFGNQRIPRQEEKAEKHPKEKFKAEQLQRDKHLVDKGVNKDQRDKEDLKMIVDKRPLQEKEKRLDEEFKTNDTNKGAMKKTVLEDRGIKSMGKKLLEEKPEQVHKIEIITGEKNVAEEQTLTGYKEKKGRRKSRIGLEEKNLKKDRITIGDKAKAEKTPFSTEVPIKKGVDVKYHMELAKKEKIKDRAGEKSGGPQETEITKKKIIDTNGTTPVEKKLINKKYETVQDKDVTIDSGDNSKSKMEMFSYKRIPLEEDKEEGPLKEKLQAKQVQRDKDLVDKSKTKDERGREDAEATKKKILDTNRTTSAEKKLMNKKYETDKDVTVDAGDKAKSKIKKFSYKRIPQGTEQEEEPLKDKLIGDERFQQENDKSIDEESRTNDANKEVIKKKEVDDRRIKSAEENVLDYKHVTKKDIITGEKEVPEQYKESRKTAGDPASMLKVGKGLGKEHLAEQAKKEQLLFDQQTKYNGQIDREKKALQQNILEDKDLSPLEKNIFKGKFRENQDQIRTDGKKLISKDQEVLNDKLRKDKNRKERLEKIVLGEEAITSTEKKVIDNAREDLMLDVREQRDKDGLKRKLIGDRIQSPREEKMLGKAENEKFRKQLVEAEEPLMSAQKVALKQRTLGDEELTNTKRESDELKQKIFGGKEKISEKVKNSEEMYQAKWPQKAKLVVDEILENDKDLKQKIFDDKKFILEEGKTIEDKSKAKKVMKLPTSEQILHGSDKLSKDEPKITILNDRKLIAKEEQMLDEQLEKENAVKLRSFGEKKSLRKYEEKREDIKKSLNDYKQLIPNEEMEKTLIFGEKKCPYLRKKC
ncbi:titin-like [Diorhabda carinulata]|uniref:titin-like n=1 Tax=Diorhabda carinulata TaxID=1163345 RepID=UPI0025A06F0F|nr:titin-like [Diorhabda carinulata]